MAVDVRRGLREVREERWAARPVAAFVIRGLVLLVPLGVGVAAGLAVARLLAGREPWALALLAVLAASTGAILVTERLARRLLPLAMLLRLSLVFPDRAPARVRVALRAGNMRNLRRWAEAEHESRTTPDAACAAERVLSLVTALGAHDRRTRGHCERVRALAEVLGRELRLAPADLDRLRWGALLHDLGKLSVPSMILNKPGKPTAGEWDALRRHPAEGLRLAGPLVEWLGPWAHGIDEHHERWDGDGYPHGRAGDEISLAGRIVAVADAFECMTEVRSYQRPRSFAEARTEITRCAGSQFDPAVVRALQTVSLARLHWIMGPISWVVQVPFVGAVPRTGVELANLASAATVGTVAQVATAAALVAAPAGPAAVASTGLGPAPAAVAAGGAPARADAAGAASSATVAPAGSAPAAVATPKTTGGIAAVTTDVAPLVRTAAAPAVRVVREVTATAAPLADVASTDASPDAVVRDGVEPLVPPADSPESPDDLAATVLDGLLRPPDSPDGPGG